MSRHKNRDHRHEQPQEPQSMGVADLSQGTSQASPQKAKRRVKRPIIIGTSMPYLPPVQEPVYGAALGYRPKKKASGIILQPNPV